MRMVKIYGTDDWERYEAVNTVRAIIDEPIRSIEQAIKHLHSYSDLAEYVGDGVYQALYQAHEILNTALMKIE